MLKLSVSSMDTYNKCPKKYHYRYIEKPDVERAKWGFTEFGSCAHRILELFHKEIIRTKSGESHYSDIMKTAFKKAVKEFDLAILEQPVWTPNGDAPGLLYLREIMQDYLNLLKNKGMPNVIGIEAPYNFKLLADGKEILVRGIIDRIDKIGDREYRVLDYKTSKNQKYLTSFQLLVYAEAVRQKYPDAETVHGSYMLLKHGCKTVDWTFAGSEIDGCKQSIIKTATYIEDDDSWVKKPSLLCRWCDYKPICQDAWTE